MKRCVLLVLATLAACTRPASDEADANPPTAQPGSTEIPNAAASTAPEAPAGGPVAPPEPGTPGGLADDRTPISEGPFEETSAQGAANVVQTYFALIEAGKYGQAWALWSDGGRASGMTADAFAASFGKFSEYHAQIGAPGQIEGAAGSLYVEVPVVTYGRLKSSAPFNMKGPVRLRRCNNVPGCTPAQLKWHIAASDLDPSPAD